MYLRYEFRTELSVERRSQGSVTTTRTLPRTQVEELRHKRRNASHPELHPQLCVVKIVDQSEHMCVSDYAAL